MKIVYEPLEGADHPWLETAIQEALRWAENEEVTPEFFGRVQQCLDDLWRRMAVALANYECKIVGFKAMVTNSALTVYPQV